MTTIKLTQVKGRPMLNWIGKQTIDIVENYPAQLVETVNNPARQVSLKYKTLIKDWSNLLFHGDNLEVLTSLLQNGFRGKIDLIYIDPPFDSKADYIRKVALRGEETNEKLEGEGHNTLEQKQYFDIWKNDDYLQFMYERLILLKELLSDKGSIYLHCDWHKSHHLRCLLDEVFGEDNFVNEIVWHYSSGGVGYDSFARKHDNVFIYSKMKAKILNTKDVKIPRSKKSLERAKNPKGARISEDNLLKLPDDVWNIPILNPQEAERESYPTQKPEALLERIIKASSNEDSIIFDCFMGSGTTQAVAQKLGRKWIGADINKGAIQTTAKRLQKIIAEQTAENTLFNGKKPIGHFAHFKVNDYDLQVLRTEAIEIAIEKLGIEKINDTFFNGKIGDSLVKIIEFNHPFSLSDMTDIDEELKHRTEEIRDISVVCLGQREDSKDPIKQWNKKKRVNKLNIVDLRHHKFMLHEPCQAQVSLKKNIITINNFVSPTIIKRLQQDKNMIGGNITDFRAMIDCVLIDNDYNDKVFNVVYSDVPAKKELVVSQYTITPKGKVAIKIIDMLGEEYFQTL